MPLDRYISTARSLALPTDDDPDDDAILPQHNFSRHSVEQSGRRQSTTPSIDRRPRTARDRWTQKAQAWQREYMDYFMRLSALQRAGLTISGILALAVVILFMIYNEAIFAKLGPAAEKWRNMRAGWLILWFMTFFVSFPPLIGYSSCVTIAGFVFGMKGWFIVATATVLGSACAFVVSRSLLEKFVSRLTERNKRFAALSLVLKHDGLKLLVMIRLCPLPYSFSNGAISTVPTVTWSNFALATAIATPKLLLHVFVGSRIGDLAENGDKMDAKTKLVSWISIAIGIVAGAATGYIVYMRTQARAKQLEAEEAAAAGDRREPGPHFSDDPAEQDAFNTLRRSDDDISMHTTRDDDLEAADGSTHQGRFTDDDNTEHPDVFEVGDGDDEPAPDRMNHE